ncbi:MAG: DUF1569 domain-containing protein [Gemmataceae bacterium]|nr:DUF1569 domain-containing protein [Gemmataceae bacterium]
MPIATDKVTDRRNVRFASYAELGEEVERVVRADEAGTLRTTGNWTAAQVLDHIGKTMQFSFDGFPFAAPLPVRMIAGVLKRVMWNKTLNLMFKPGFQLPPSAAPMLPGNDANLSDAAALVRSQIQRIQQGEPMTAKSPLLGMLSNAQWMEIHLRHAAVHLNFIHHEKP